jgi:hypothetical protein
MWDNNHHPNFYEIKKITSPNKYDSDCVVTDQLPPVGSGFLQTKQENKDFVYPVPQLNDVEMFDIQAYLRMLQSVQQLVGWKLPNFVF